MLPNWFVLPSHSKTNDCNDRFWSSFPSASRRRLKTASPLKAFGRASKIFHQDQLDPFKSLSPFKASLLLPVQCWRERGEREIQVYQSSIQKKLLFRSTSTKFHKTTVQTKKHVKTWSPNRQSCIPMLKDVQNSKRKALTMLRPSIGADPARLRASNLELAKWEDLSSHHHVVSYLNSGVS